MTLTLLLDLDDTLLRNDIERFLPQYLNLFAKSVENLLNTQDFVQALLSGTRAMLQNQQADRTLQQAFEETFFKQVHVAPHIFHETAMQFYEQVYPKLQASVRPIPAAARVVRTAQQRGYRLVLATNPLFPETAIRQRLSWAELDVEASAFELITSYETFHFAKPNPAYFAEILARLGWPEGGVLVVGDDLERDILPGHQLGLTCYWVHENRSTPAVNAEAILGQGSLEDMLKWLDAIPLERLQPEHTHPIAILAILLSTPAALDSLLRSLSEEEWREHPIEGEWGFTEILCHLRDVDGEVNLPRVDKILAETNPFLPGENTDAWAKERRYAQQDGRKALQEFIQTRQELLSLLQPLSEAAWSRGARHAIFGPTRLDELMHIVVSHDQVHLRQVITLLRQLGHYR